MKTILTILTLLCATLICSPQSFAQNFVDGQMPDTFLKHGAGVNDIKFSPDGKMIASGGTDTYIKLWDVASGRFKGILIEHSEAVTSVAFSPDGKLLASGSKDKTIKLWDVASGTLKGILHGHEDYVYSVAFSPDGKLLASGSKDKTIKLWDVASGTLKGTLHGHKDYVYSVAFSPDGKLLASGSEDKTIKLWDVASGALKDILHRHKHYVYSVAFSPDGRTLAASGDEYNREYDTVRLWDVASQPKAPKATLSYHGGDVTSVTFSPDGTTLASGSGDGAVRLWRALPPANGDGIVNIADLVEVAQNFGQVGENNADVNGDGVVNIVDLILVAVALGEVAAAPAANAQAFSMLTAEEVTQWLIEAKQLQHEDPKYFRGILFLQQLLVLLTPKETMLLPNYPNPFNPETWIPYQLATSADVILTIYGINGHVVRTVDLGQQAAGIYQNRNRAAYWDGKTAQGEPVASGVYFYTLTAGDFTATRKMLIRK